MCRAAWGAGAGVSGTGSAGSEATGARGTTNVAPIAPHHRYDTRLQALRRLEREEQKRLEQERQELRQLDQQEQQQPRQQQLQLQQPLLLQQLFPPVSGLRALGLPSSPPIRSQSPIAYGPTLPPPDSAPAVFSPPHSQSPPPVLPHVWTSRCPPRARPSSLRV
ncbi:unnamed protein product [Closterium sp. NIES-53]